MKQPASLPTAGLLFALIRRLEAVYDNEEARAVARIVMEDGLSLDYTRLCAGTERDLAPHEAQWLETATERLLQGCPVQYVMGQAVFCDRWFSVSPAVLIPRPETEELVAHVVERYADAGPCSLADAGTGSGCIALSLAAALPESHIVAFDVSREALEVANKNAVAHELTSRVTLLEANLLHPETLPVGPFDAIVSNPPYIRASERAQMDRRVTDHEPEGALFVPDADPLRFYAALAEWGKTALRQGGQLFMEINAALGQETCNLCREAGYNNVELLRDRYGKDRIVICSR